jgi:hypothetical protein
MASSGKAGGRPVLVHYTAAYSKSRPETDALMAHCMGPNSVTDSYGVAVLARVDA